MTGPARLSRPPEFRLPVYRPSRLRRWMLGVAIIGTGAIVGGAIGGVIGDRWPPVTILQAAVLGLWALAGMGFWRSAERWRYNAEAWRAAAENWHQAAVFVLTGVPPGDPDGNR